MVNQSHIFVCLVRRSKKRSTSVPICWCAAFFTLQKMQGIVWKGTGKSPKCSAMIEQVASSSVASGCRRRSTLFCPLGPLLQGTKNLSLCFHSRFIDPNQQLEESCDDGWWVVHPNYEKNWPPFPSPYCQPYHGEIWMFMMPETCAAPLNVSQGDGPINLSFCSADSSERKCSPWYLCILS